MRRISLALLAVTACSGPPDETWTGLKHILAPLEAYGLHPTPADDAIATLEWQAPRESCPYVYRVRASYEPAQMHEEDSVSTLALGPLPAGSRGAVAMPEGVPIPIGEVAPLRLYYHGLRAEKRGATRDVFASATQYGPSAPTAACLPRTWDPMEDALALGWPQLPDHPLVVGDRWTGARVQGKCARSPCVDPHTGGGGEENHGRACVSMSWQERLAGVYEIGGERFALIESHWDDGHEDDQGKYIGISTDRLTLVSIDHGRPTWSRTIVDHRFPQPAADRSFQPVVRTWVLEAADECPGSLATIGWQRSDEDASAVTDALEGLRNSDELRKRESKSKRARDEADIEPFAPAGPPDGPPL